jgi:hypothetical protein
MWGNGRGGGGGQMLSPTQTADAKRFETKKIKKQGRLLVLKIQDTELDSGGDSHDNTKEALFGQHLHGCTAGHQSGMTSSHRAKRSSTHRCSRLPFQQYILKSS